MDSSRFIGTFLIFVGGGISGGITMVGAVNLLL